VYFPKPAYRCIYIYIYNGGKGNGFFGKTKKKEKKQFKDSTIQRFHADDADLNAD
jgi:hypothetical protein